MKLLILILQVQHSHVNTWYFVHVSHVLRPQLAQDGVDEILKGLHALTQIHSAGCILCFEALLDELGFDVPDCILGELPEFFKGLWLLFHKIL